MHVDLMVGVELDECLTNNSGVFGTTQVTHRWHESLISFNLLTPKSLSKGNTLSAYHGKTGKDINLLICH